MEDYDEQLAKAKAFHGEICGGIAIGTKLAMYGMELMGMELNQRHKNLIVFLEIESLKQMYYGKFAVTFYNMDNGEAIRVADADANKSDKKRETKEEMIQRFRETPAEELFSVQKVHVELKPSQMPGKPHTSTFCSICGEKITDGRHLNRGGKPVCIPCAEGAYYEIIDE